jgi:hypothetical protein
VADDGMSSTSFTSAALGPLFRTVTVYFASWWTRTAFGPDFVTAMSAVPEDEVIVVFTVSLLGLGPGSVVDEDTVAVFDNAVVPVSGLTTNVNVAVALDASEAIVHVTVVVPLHENAGPVFCATDTNVLPVGTTSVRETDCAASGP